MRWAGRTALGLCAGIWLGFGAVSGIRGEEPVPKAPGGPLQPDGKAGGLLTKSFPHGAAELLTFGLTPEQLRELETNEMIGLVGEIYRPEKGDQDRVAAEIGRIQAGRWENNPEIHPYLDLLSKRAERFAALSQELKSTDSPWKQIRQLRRDTEFNKLLNEIKQYEYKHAHNLNAHLDRIETLIDPAKVEEAHQDWPRRVRNLRSAIQITRLCDGLHTRKALLQRQRASLGQPGAPAPGTAPPEVPAGRDRHEPPAPPRERISPPPASSAERPRPLSEWERYVYDFIARYELTEAQSNSALAILRELSSRAAQIESLNRDRIAAAEKIADAKARQERIAELNRPMDELFGQLKQRLDRLLSAAQRNKANAQPPARAGGPGGRGR